MFEYDSIKYYTADEIAKIMQTSVISVRKLIKGEHLKATKIGSRWLIADYNLKNYLSNTFKGVQND